MIATQHAVTPTDTRQPPAAASEKPESRPSEMLAELTELSLELADEAARSDIECCCKASVSGGKDWYDPRHVVGNEVDLPRNEELINRALRYFQLRGDSCTTFQLVRSTAFPSLFRFEARS